MLEPGSASDHLDELGKSLNLICKTDANPCFK